MLNYLNKLKAFVCLTAFFSLLLLAAPQSNAQDDKIYQTVSGPELLEIMKAEGYSASLDSDEDIKWDLEGNDILILFYDDNTSFQLYHYVLKSGVPLDKINSWNSTKRYSRSYIDGDGDPVLELDFDASGGVTRAALVEWLYTCEASLKAWHEMIDEVRPARGSKNIDNM